MDTQERGRLWTLILVSVGLFMVVLDNLVVNVALPSIHNDFGASVQALEWTVNAYVLPYGVLLLTGAALGGRRAGSQRRPADRGPCHPGRRRGDRHAAHPDPPRSRLPARKTRPRPRRL